MAPARVAPRVATPVDALVAAYSLLAAAALAFPHRPAHWPAILLAHLALAGAALLARNLRPRFTRGPVAFLLDCYPLLLVPFLYSELDTLNRAVWNGVFFDDAIQRVEALVFGTQPSVRWSRVMPVLPLSELLHAAYLAYYPLIYLPPLLIYARRMRDEFRVMVFALLLTFAAHYVFFVYFPVQGPRYLFPAPTGGLERGAVYALAHRILEAGSSQGAAFPSSHVGVAVAQTILLLRFTPRVGIAAAIVSVLLAAGAVYGGFHYAIDAFAGAALGAATCLYALRWLPREGPTAAGLVGRSPGRYARAGHEAPPGRAHHEEAPGRAGHEEAPGRAGHEEAPGRARHEEAPGRAGHEEAPEP